MSVVRFIVATRSNILISGKIIKEMPGSVATGTYCVTYLDKTELLKVATPVAVNRIKFYGCFQHTLHVSVVVAVLRH